MFSQPSRPVREYYQNINGMMMTDRATARMKNFELKDDLDCVIERREYSRKISRYETQLEVWGDNSAK